MDVEELLKAFIHRSRFKYKLVQIFEYLGKCFCLRKTRSLRGLDKNHIHYKFKKGKRKLEHELDVIQLLKNMRKFKLI